MVTRYKSRIDCPQMFAQTASYQGQRCCWSESYRHWWWPEKIGSVHWVVSCSASSGPNSLTWIATQSLSPWSKPSAHLLLLQRLWPKPSWSRSGHWLWTLFLPFSHKKPWKNNHHKHIRLYMLYRNITCHVWQKYIFEYNFKWWFFTFGRIRGLCQRGTERFARKPAQPNRSAGEEGCTSRRCRWTELS